MDGVLISILPEYSNVADVFFLELFERLPEHTEINYHAINLNGGKQQLYRLIYSLKLVELEALKTYIEINLVNNFIRPSKSPADALILLVRKPDSSLCLCVNYQVLNNLTIKNLL